MNKYYNYNKFEKKVIKLINRTRFSKTDKRFSDMMTKIMKKHLKNVSLVINKDSIKFSIYENKTLKIINYLNFFDLNSSLKTKIISLQKEKIFTLLRLIIFLYENRAIELINLKENEDETISINLLEGTHTTDILNYHCNEFIKILNSDYICNLQELVKSKFQSVESRNLIITRRALYISIASSILIPLFSNINNSKKIININNVKVNTLPTQNSKTNTDLLSYGQNVEILEKKNNFYLVEYSKNDIKKVGWVEKNSIKNIYFWEKYF